MALLGIDIFNGNSDGYNMAQVKADGVSFVIHKASQGWSGGPGGWMDWKIANAIARARAAGIPVLGGYHWLLRGNGRAQADLYYQSMKAIGGPNGMLCAVDVERNDWNQSLNPDAATLLDFLNEWNALSGNHPILIYSAEWYWGPYMGEPRQFSLYPLWWAGYYEPYGSQPIQQASLNVTPGYLNPFGGWTTRAIRQWTSRGVVAGIPSDCNYFDGSLADLQKLTVPGGQPVPAPKPVPAPAGVNVKAVQAAVKAVQDGVWGPDTDRRCELVRHRGPNLPALQLVLGVKADGIWGPNTNFAYVVVVREIQAALKVAVDGIWGPATDAAYLKASPLR